MKKYNANKKEFYTLIILGLLFIGFTSPDPVKRKYSISQRWLTYPSESILFQPTAYESGIKSKPDKTLNIDINEQKVYQEMDGFGFTLTGGSARLINQMSTTNKKELLYELFSATEGIGISYLRLSIGASDLSDSVFTYNDMPPGKTDPQLKQFNMDMERVHLIPVLKEILAINPEIKIMGSPWSAPAWMKTNESAIGGSLRQEYFEAYSTYFVRYIEEMQKNNIHIDAITVQNEPLHPGNNPSMYMTAEQQAMFIKNNLGPALKKANLNTKIIIYDHNADRIDYPLEVLSDSEAYPYIDGTAFHLYGGNIEDISKVHTAFPDKNLYFTEQWIGAPGNLEEDLKWHTENLIIGATRNWCKTVLEWNLAADKYQQPHTDQGGCTRCLGAITIDGDSVLRNPAYYIVAHASKFVQPGSVRIATKMLKELPNVAFKTHTGSLVLIVLNKSNKATDFNITAGNSTISASLEAGAVASYILTPDSK